MSRHGRASGVGGSLAAMPVDRPLLAVLAAVGSGGHLYLIRADCDTLAGLAIAAAAGL